ncbi:MAG: alpha/beta hydrolase [Anaerolineae bacterium]|nr:alpha/beta hydrolase [Anaerolineae bacterium]
MSISYASKIITVDGHTLRYHTAGDPSLPPLLMVHGWFSYRGVWRQTIPALQDRFYCVAVDLLGFGDSDKPSDADYSIPAQGQRMLDVADQLGFARFALIGHSMGGQIALCIASMLAPERITQLVSVDGVVAAQLMPAVDRVYAIVAIIRHIPWLYTVARWMDHFKPYAYWNHRPWFYEMDSVPFDEWEIDRNMAMQAGLHMSAYKAGIAIRALDLTPHLPHITAPTLAIFGAQDGTVPVSDGHLVDQHVPDSELVLIENCGHFPMYEHTTTYLAALTQFLTKS